MNRIFKSSEKIFLSLKGSTFKVFCFFLVAALLLEIYKSGIFDSSDSGNRDEWTPGQIYLALQNTKKSSIMNDIRYQVFSFKKKWGNLFEPKKNYSPKSTIGAFRLPGGCPLEGYLCGELTTSDEQIIIKKYKKDPFMFSVGDKINEKEEIENLEKGGYTPTKGVYDDLFPELVKEGFSFPDYNSKGGYSIFIKKEEIIHIRKIRDYKQYLTAWKNKTNYTAQGIYYFYISLKAPNYKDISVFLNYIPVNKWTPEQIAYAYISNQNESLRESIKYRNTISQKTLQDVFHQFYKAFESPEDLRRLHISVSDEDIKEIINEYGEHPFRLRFYDKINEAVVFQNLERAGYHPHSFSGECGNGFCFSLKNSSQGYAVFIEHGIITDIRKLWNYGHFLNAKEKGVDCRSREYTTEGVFILYLPDFSKQN